MIEQKRLAEKKPEQQQQQKKATEEVSHRKEIQSDQN